MTSKTNMWRPKGEASGKDLEAGKITNPLTSSVFRLSPPSVLQKAFIAFLEDVCLLLAIRYFQSASRRLVDGKSQIFEGIGLRPSLHRELSFVFSTEGL